LNRKGIEFRLARDTKSVYVPADLKGEVISFLKERRESSYSMQGENVIVFNIIGYITVEDRSSSLLLCTCSDLY